MDERIITADGILALSWSIATEPKLYWELAANPYSSVSLKIISERFPGYRKEDIIRAVVLAEPEGRYDRNFRQLSKDLQEAEVCKQDNEANEIIRRLNECYSQHVFKIAELSEDLMYDVLLKIAFEGTNLQEIGQKYGQSQRKRIKLLILDLIGGAQALLYIEGQEHLQKSASKSRKIFSKTAFAVLSIISFFYLTYLVLDKQSLVADAANRIMSGQTQNATVSQKANGQVLSTETKRNESLPVRLQIPSIEVDSVIESMGLTSEGAMDVPGNKIDVGWYKFGSRPGESGSAVISGHFDGREGESGVFNNLNKLKKGDKVYVVNDKGATVTFVVRESKIYNPGYAEEVFSPHDNGIHLNLVTCDGIWDKDKKSYTERLVVFADIVKE